jgi:Flp pilus assembly protein TadG
MAEEPQLLSRGEKSRRPEENVSLIRDRGALQSTGKRARWAKEKGAAEIFEAALVLGMLLTLLVGVLYLSLAFSTYQTLTRAAQDAARAAALPSGVASAYACPSAATVQSSLTTALNVAGVDATKVTGLTVTCDPQTNAGTSLNEPEVKLSFTYPYVIQLPLYSGSLTFTINAQAKQEN